MTFYYVSAAGNDSNAGTEIAPWLTVAKVNASTFNPGDVICFRGGDTWYEVLQPPGSRGEGVSKLVITSYGNGMFNLSNYKIVTDPNSWVDVGGNKWTLDLTNTALYAGYQLTTGEGRNVGHLRLGAGGVIKGAKKFTLGALAAQWDFHSDMTTGVLTVYSVGNPTGQAPEIRIAVGNRLIDGPASAPNELTGLWISGMNADGCAGHCIGDAVRDTVIVGCRIQAMGGGHQTSAPVANTRYGNGIQFGLSSRRAIGIGNIITDCYDTATTCQGERSGGASAFIDCHFIDNEIADCEQAFELYLNNDNGLGWAAGVGFDNVSFAGNTCHNIGYGWSHDVRPDQNAASPLLFYSMDAPLNDVLVEGNSFYRFRGNFLHSGSGDDLPSGYTIGRNYVFGRADQQIYNRGTSYNMTQWSSFASSIGTGSRTIVEILATATDASPETTLHRLTNLLSEATARLNIQRRAFTDLGGLIARAFGAGQMAITSPSAPIVLTDGANIATDLFLGKLFRVTLGGNRTLDNPTNLAVDDRWTIRVTQDGTGGRTLVFGALYDAAGGVLPTLTAAAGAIDYLYFHYDGTRIVVTAELNV